jgi:AcrR family transcriptional regulator
MQRRAAHPPPPRAKAPVNASDPRVKRTRKALQDALVELMAEKKFDAISVQDIADRSTINRTTFYDHFADKSDLFAGYSREWFRKALEERLPADAVLTHGNLELLILASMEALAQMDDHCAPTEALKPLVMSAVQEELSRFLLGWLQVAPACLTQPPVARETTAAGLSWAIFGTALDWSRMPERAPAQPRAAQIATLLTGGLSSVLADTRPSSDRVDPRSV